MIELRACASDADYELARSGLCNRPDIAGNAFLAPRVPPEREIAWAAANGIRDLPLR